MTTWPMQWKILVEYTTLPPTQPASNCLMKCQCVWLCNEGYQSCVCCCRPMIHVLITTWPWYETKWLAIHQHWSWPQGLKSLAGLPTNTFLMLTLCPALHPHHANHMSIMSIATLIEQTKTKLNQTNPTKLKKKCPTQLELSWATQTNADPNHAWCWQPWEPCMFCGGNPTSLL